MNVSAGAVNEQKYGRTVTLLVSEKKSEHKKRQQRSHRPRCERCKEEPTYDPAQAIFDGMQPVVLSDEQQLRYQYRRDREVRDGRQSQPHPFDDGRACISLQPPSRRLNK